MIPSHDSWVWSVRRAKLTDLRRMGLFLAGMAGIGRGFEPVSRGEERGG